MSTVHVGPVIVQIAPVVEYGEMPGVLEPVPNQKATIYGLSRAGKLYYYDRDLKRWIYV